MNGKTIAIGDIHGCLTKLKSLMNNLVINKDDVLVFIGDYIDRGRESAGVIDYIQELKKKYTVITLKGNHEQFALDSLKYVKDHSPRDLNMFMSWLRNGGRDCLESYYDNLDDSVHAEDAVLHMFERHASFFDDLQLTYENDTHIYVHGYLNHDLDCDEQSSHLCVWSRYEDIKPHKSDKIVVVGHTIQREFKAKDDGYKIGIDTGSFLTDGCITAMLTKDGHTSFVDSKGRKY